MRQGSPGSGMVGAALVIAAAALWATVGVAVRLVPEAATVPPEALGLARTVLAGPLILLAALPTARVDARTIRTLRQRRLVDFALAGVVFQIGLFRSFESIGVTITVVMTVCLPPVLATFFSYMRGAPLDQRGLSALALALLGLGLFSHESLRAGAGQDTLGLGFAIIASVAFVWMSDAARHLASTASPVLVAGSGLTIAGLAFCALGPWLFEEPLQLVRTVATNYALLGLIVYLAVVPTALAYICYCAGIVRCRSTVVGLTASMIEPAIAAVLAMVLVNERLTGYEIAGCILMALAMAVLMHAETRVKPVPVPAPSSP